MTGRKLTLPKFSKRETNTVPATTVRPVSRTCIIAKCMEHILVSNMMKHLELNNILHPLQHGFRKNYSCEAQLLSLFQDLASNPSHIDLIIMDFSKAFDKVPHRRLGNTRDWYGIRGNTREWIFRLPLRQVPEGCSGTIAVLTIKKRDIEAACCSSR